MNIIEMAITAELIDHRDTEESLPRLYMQSLNEFASLVYAEALEEAAKVCDEHANASKMVYTGMSAMHCAAAIRELKAAK